MQTRYRKEISDVIKKELEKLEQDYNYRYALKLNLAKELKPYLDNECIDESVKQFIEDLLYTSFLNISLLRAKEIMQKFLNKLNEVSIE